MISIHALREEGDGELLHSAGRHVISIHALREEGDPPVLRTHFNRSISIHALREEGDIGSWALKCSPINFYPRPPRGGRRGRAGKRSAYRQISIHALREEGDVVTTGIPRGTVRFLSTPSARRATAKTETKSLFSNKLYNILHEFRRALIYNGSKNYPNHAK